MNPPGTHPGQRRRPALKPLYALLLSSMACWQDATQALPVSASTQVAASGVEFESSFLHEGGQGIDLSRYAQGNIVPPGVYSADIHVNGHWAGRSEVRLIAVPGQSDAQPCLARPLLASSGVDLAALPAAVTARLADDGACLPVAEIMAGASAHFDFDSLRLELGIPQVALRRRARGYVSPAQWDAGVPMGLLGYHLNTHHAARSGSGASSTQGYLGLNAGFNLDRWHLRHNGSASWNDRGGKSYQNISTYVQRDIAAWSSQLLLGDAYTGGDLLDSTPFRGLRLHSDDRMLPASQRGYAPVVRGVAHTNARVTVTQNGMKLYETTVAPGPFVIDDLYATGYGGDLQVDITEADGSVRRFNVPYAGVPLSLREGQHRYSLTAGVVRHLPQSTPFMSQGTWQYGFTNGLTGYGGATVAQGYLAPMLGLVLHTGAGAFGVDLTHARTRIPGDKTYTGQSLRASYARMWSETGTHIALAAYRHSTHGFFGLNDALLARDPAQRNRPPTGIGRPRQRASLNLSQQVGTGGGHLNLVASTSRYGNGQRAQNDFTIGYSNVWRSISYNLSATRQRDAQGLGSTLLYAGLSIPLGGNLLGGTPLGGSPLGGERPSMLATHANRDSTGRLQTQTHLTGLLGQDNALAYTLSTQYGRGGRDGAGTQASGSASASYRGRHAEFSGSLSAGSGYRQFSAAARGAIVAHPGGVTLSQPVGETFAIVEARHAEGARIPQATGVTIDAQGYAIVPYLTPYALNEVSIDPKGLSTDVSLHATSQHVAPIAGAVPLLVFKTSYSRSAVISARQPDGSPVPFGAMVSDMSGQDLAMVGQAGKLLARGLADEGALQVQWKTATGHAVCHLAYALPPRQRAAADPPITRLDLPCVAGDRHQYARAAAPPGPPAAPAPAPAVATERLLAGLQLSTTVRVLLQQTGADATRPPRPAPTADGLRPLKIERTLSSLRQNTLASAAAGAGRT